MERFQIMMSKPIMDDLRKLAKDKGFAISDVIRRACEEYLSKQDKNDKTNPA